jgi:predicted transcriptional regulator
MQIGEICRREVVTIDKSASILDAARLMRSEHVGDLIVADGDGERCRPLSIVTDRDLVVELLAKEVDLDSVNVGDVASPRMVTAPSDADLLETLRLMSVKGVRRIPVLDSEGYLFGILSAGEVLDTIKDQLTLLQALSSRRIERERSVRD